MSLTGTAYHYCKYVTLVLWEWTNSIAHPHWHCGCDSKLLIYIASTAGVTHQHCMILPVLRVRPDNTSDLTYRYRAHSPVLHMLYTLKVIVFLRLRVISQFYDVIEDFGSNALFGQGQMKNFHWIFKVFNAFTVNFQRFAVLNNLCVGEQSCFSQTALLFIIFGNISLTKLMVSHDLPRSTVTNQIVFDQRDLYSAPEFEGTMDHRCQALVSKLETSDTITFT